MLDTPVAIIIFNRPDLARGLVQELRAVAPQRLFVIADGARSPAESRLVEESRRAIEEIDWPCAVTKIYSDTNLGCRNRIITGLTQVFEEVEQAIILEDDIRPDPTFFLFCREMLRLYESDTRIFTITSGHFTGQVVPGNSSYHFSLYPSAWGWATWRRTWKLYDGTMALWPQLKQMNWLSSYLGNTEEASFFIPSFDGTHAGQIDTWDYQLTYSCFIQNGLNVVPNVTLARNIGIGRADATHTKHDSIFMHMGAGSLAFPLRHPPAMIQSSGARQIYRRTHQNLVTGFFT